MVTPTQKPTGRGSTTSDMMVDSEKDAEKDAGPGTDASSPPGPPGAERLAGEADLWMPRSAKFWGNMLCNFVALFLIALDRTIVATAIPRITDDFRSLGDIGWYGSAYMLTTSCAQLLFGRVYKFYDTKAVFLASLVVFEAGSAICGAAPSSPVFILGRAVAGAAAAGVFSGCALNIVSMVPLHKRPMFQGLLGMVFGLASVLGPLVGGGFATNVTWRWCFYINLPLGGAALLFLLRFWHPPRADHPPVPFWAHVTRLDPVGMVVLLPGMVCLLLVLQWGGATYAWDSWCIVLLLVLFGVLLIAFAVYETMTPNTAMVPSRVITQRSVACATGFTFLIAGSMLMLIYYLAIWFQAVKQVDPVQSGIDTLPLMLGMVAASILSGVFTHHIGYYVPSMLASPSLMATGVGLMVTFSPATPASRWIGYQFLAGFGLGCGMQQGSMAAQTVLPRADVSVGMAINFFVQQLGGAVFTSVGQSLLSNLLAREITRAGVPGLDAAAIVGEGVTNLLKTVPAQYLGIVLAAYNFACTRIFLGAAVLSATALLCALGMEWRSIKPAAQAGAPTATASKKDVATAAPDAAAASPAAVESAAPATAAGPKTADSLADGVRDGQRQDDLKGKEEQ